MWPFALLSLGCVPFMGFASSVEMASYSETDTSRSDSDEESDGINTPGGILVETLLNIRTVAALTLEKQRYSDYQNALARSEPGHARQALMSGITTGLSVLIQQWVYALQLFFGAWILSEFEDFGFRDFLIANFAMLFALSGLGAAFQDISDRKKVEKGVGRILYLWDRQSLIDPLGEGGTRLNI
jgi:ATP-binding cassette, subfamily B (MDR/TAP), member 1